MINTSNQIQNNIWLTDEVGFKISFGKTGGTESLKHLSWFLYGSFHDFFRIDYGYRTKEFTVTFLKFVFSCNEHCIG